MRILKTPIQTKRYTTWRNNKQTTHRTDRTGVFIATNLVSCDIFVKIFGHDGTNDYMNLKSISESSIYIFGNAVVSVLLLVIR